MARPINILGSRATRATKQEDPFKDWLEEEPSSEPTPAPIVPQAAPQSAPAPLLRQAHEADHFGKAVTEVMEAHEVATMPWVQAAIDAKLENVKGSAGVTIIVRTPQEDLTRTLEERAHPLLDDVVRRMAAGIHLMLVGPTGCGKTFLFYQACRVLGITGDSASITEGTSEGQLFGRRLPGPNGEFIYTGAPFVSCVEEGRPFLADEADSANPNMLLGFNQVVANGRLPLYNRIERPYADAAPGFCLALACNTYGQGADRMYVGRNQLDAATLDRFAGSVLDMDYDAGLEQSIVSREVFDRFYAARMACRSAKLRRNVSTRAMLNADKLLTIGYTLPQVWARFTAGWSAEELSKVGGA